MLHLVFFVGFVVVVFLSEENKPIKLSSKNNVN